MTSGGDRSIDELEREFVARTEGEGVPGADRFGVKIDGVAVEGWTLVDLPTVSTERASNRGGTGARKENEGTDRSSHALLAMERTVDPGDEGYVWDWIDDVRRGKVDGSRRDIVVVLEDADGNPLTRWELAGCWPKNYEPPDLDASADADDPTERLTVVAPEYANRPVERICGHHVDDITGVYSRSTDAIPGPLRGLVTDATIHGVVAGDDDGDYTVRTGPEAEPTAVIDRKPSAPDLVVETNCETLTGIVTADDPRASFERSYEDGDVRVHGTGILSGIVTGIAHALARLSDVLD